MSEYTKGELTFELSEEPSKHCSYGDLILNGKIFARDIHRDCAIDTMKCWNSHDALEEKAKQRDALLAACEAIQDAREKFQRGEDFSENHLNELLDKAIAKAKEPAIPAE